MRSGGHSGAAGLTLTVANHAFIMDPAWNPALEDQAIARIARIGQKRETTVWRMVTDKTVEDRVVEIAGRKRMTGRRNGGSSSTSSLLANVSDAYSTDDVSRLFDLQDTVGSGEK